MVVNARPGIAATGDDMSAADACRRGPCMHTLGDTAPVFGSGETEIVGITRERRLIALKFGESRR